MVGLIQLALLVLFVAFASGSESCSSLSHQLSGVGLIQQFQRRHTVASPAAGPSILSSQVQPAPIVIVGSIEPPQGAAVHLPANRSAESPPVAPQSAAAQLPSAAAQPPDAATKGPIGGASQVTQQEPRSGMKSSVDTTKQEKDQEVILQHSNTSIKVDQKEGLINVDKKVGFNTNDSIITDLTPEAPRSPKVPPQWSKNSMAQAPRSPKVPPTWKKNGVVDGLCVVGAFVIMFLFLVLADVI